MTTDVNKSHFITWARYVMFNCTFSSGGRTTVPLAPPGGHTLSIFLCPSRLGEVRVWSYCSVYKAVKWWQTAL